jgi:hypothetical protein
MIKIRFVVQALRIIAQPGYAFWTCVIGLLFLYFSALLPVRSFVGLVIRLPHISFLAKVKTVIITPFESLPLNFSGAALVLLIITAILVGINTTLLVYLIRERVGAYKNSGLTILGMVSAVLGIGCSACGSVVLTTLLSLSATSAIIGFLPLHGLEFSLVSVGLLVLSLGLVMKKIGVKVCEVEI